MSDQKTNRRKRAVWMWIKPLVAPGLLLAVGAMLIVGLGVAQRAGWIGGGGAEPEQSAAAEKVLYVCPMMCTPPLEAPGRCPVCEMELMPSKAQADGPTRSIEIDPASRRIANIRTAQVKSKAVVHEIRAVGRLSYDEGTLKTLAAYVDGRIEQMYADYTGVVVEQGDDLAVLYSPELYTAQTELLAAKQAAGREKSPLYSDALDLESVYRSVRRKLLDLGMTEGQIERLEATGKPETRLEIVAPIHGTVIEKLAAEGDYVKTGQPIYRLADLTTVWLMLELFPEDATSIRYGQRVEAEVQSLAGQQFAGRVAFVDPTVDPKTRTVGVRVVIDNQGGRLKIGDYATAVIAVALRGAEGAPTDIYDPALAGKWISPRHPHVIEDTPGACRVCGIELVPASTFGFSDEPIDDRKALVVPRSAVLMAGDNSVVYVETEPGRFELRSVDIGPSIADEIVLLSGVEEGETVATGGNFLIDSQMQLGGNPSLIDPTKAEPSEVDDEPEENPFPMIDLPPIGEIEIIDSADDMPEMDAPPIGEMELIEMEPVEDSSPTSAEAGK